MDRVGFEALLEARSIALIGASDNPETLSGRPLGLLSDLGYAGRVYPVNPNRQLVQGRNAYRLILDVPERLDVAMVAVRAELVPAAIRECVEANVGAAIIV